jgi:hypothetical protein
MLVLLVTVAVDVAAEVATDDSGLVNVLGLPSNSPCTRRHTAGRSVTS